MVASLGRVSAAHPAGFPAPLLPASSHQEDRASAASPCCVCPWGPRLGRRWVRAVRTEGARRCSLAERDRTSGRGEAGRVLSFPAQARGLDGEGPGPASRAPGRPTSRRPPPPPSRFSSVPHESAPRPRPRIGHRAATKGEARRSSQSGRCEKRSEPSRAGGPRPRVPQPRHGSDASLHTVRPAGA